MSEGLYALAREGGKAEGERVWVKYPEVKGWAEYIRASREWGAKKEPQN
jgi:hypothetical protein